MASLPALASLADLEVRMPRAFTADEMPGAQAALDDASTLVRTEAGTDWVDASNELDDPPGIVVSITLTAAKRALRNPDGVTQETLGSASFSYSPGDGGLYLTKSERRMIRRGLGFGGLGSVALESPYAPLSVEGTYFAEVEGTTERMPLYGDPGYGW